jgi:hypothetical protein
MTLDEQIAVMDAFRNGAKIDSRPKVVNVVPSVWCENDTPGWNWSAVEYLSPIFDGQRRLSK